MLIVLILLLVSFLILIYIIFKDRHTHDNYTSAQPPPPFSNVVTEYGRPIAGIDCTSECPPDAYFRYFNYPIYNYENGLGYNMV